MPTAGSYTKLSSVGIANDGGRSFRSIRMGGDITLELPPDTLGLPTLSRPALRSHVVHSLLATMSPEEGPYYWEAGALPPQRPSDYYENHRVVSSVVVDLTKFDPRQPPPILLGILRVRPGHRENLRFIKKAKAYVKMVLDVKMSWRRRTRWNYWMITYAGPLHLLAKATRLGQEILLNPDHYEDPPLANEDPDSSMEEQGEFDSVTMW